ncbi:GcrA family cell cycle regulator [Mesorhizobium sp. B2-4-7]|uniref:GcrA family cell cycle regulator n=1 Tax=Mesorhizobium sp. B2-4-7 TaxID=2589942 RepID=UPI001128B7E6|nr:GcrA family cell cycle regulator [Mesorhizobium sp. B2-4-7]TPL30203.1 hypothetical protein FJ946_02745 [Mesorhizobium sp. B2-4-7]
MSGWTLAETELLRRLAGEGLSAGKISAQMPGRSRNSIISKLDRGKGRFGKLAGQPTNDLRSPRRDAPPKLRRAPRPPVKPKIIHASPARQILAEAPPVVPVANLPAALPITFLEAMNRKRCLHYVGDPFAADGPDMAVCGAERSLLSGLKPYCRKHLASSFRAVPA